MPIRAIYDFMTFSFAATLAGRGGINVFFAETITPLVSLLSFIIGLITLFCLFLYFMRPNLVISIKNKTGVGNGPVDIRRKTIRSESTGFAEVMPTDETEGAIREMGALIKDIQELGDYGLEKWLK